MIMDMVHLLAVAIVNHHPKMIRQVELLGDDLNCRVEHSQNLGRSAIKIDMLSLRDYQQMDQIARSMIGDDDHFIRFVKDLGRDLSVDDASKD